MTDTPSTPETWIPYPGAGITRAPGSQKYLHADLLKLSIADILTSNEDLLVRRAGDITRLAKPTEEFPLVSPLGYVEGVLGSSSRLDDWPLQRRRRQATITAVPNRSTPAIHVDGLPSALVTEFEPGTTAQADKVSQPNLEYSTGVVAGGYAGIETALDLWRYGWNTTLVMHIRPGNTALSRQWWGLTDTTLDGVSTPSGIELCALRYDASITSPAETTLQFITSDGVTNEITDTLIAPTGARNYNVVISNDKTSGSVSCWVFVANVLYGPFTHSTNIPANNTNCGVVMSVESTTTTERKLGFTRLEVACDG